MRKFRDGEGFIITDKELYQKFLELKKIKGVESETFSQYMWNCLENGTLERIASDDDVRYLRNVVARDIADNEFPYKEVRRLMDENDIFGNWTPWEMNHRPVGAEEIKEFLYEQYERGE